MTPRLHESAVRLGAWLPFRPAAAMLAHVTGVAVDAATVRRLTEGAGAAYVAVQTAAVERLEREAPAPPAGPPTQQVSVDGAMVPLVGGERAEVKTLAIGTVQEPAQTDGQAVAHTSGRSYFSRLADYATFTRLALVETYRRGVTTAGRVAGVVAGALWEQGVLDYHRPDAVRILDFAHGAARVAAIGQAAGVADPAGAWLQAQLHELRHGTAPHALAGLRAVRDDLTRRQDAGEAVGPALARVTTNPHHLEERQAQLAYATFTAAGLPIGSGAVESANKLVVEARLKGAGMHWARAHVNPVVALRTIVCNDRWGEAWPQIVAERRAQLAARQRGRRRHRRATTPPPARHDAVPPPVVAPAVPPAPPTRPPRRPSVAARAAGPRRPAANHPWRRYRQRLPAPAA